ncbi:MAG: hypothetical protein AAF501_12100 [Pseudomonadota bacterium]
MLGKFVRGIEPTIENAWLIESMTSTVDNVHLLSGPLLPVWKRLSVGNLRVYRLELDDGTPFFGRLFDNEGAGIFRARLRAEGCFTEMIDWQLSMVMPLHDDRPRTLPLFKVATAILPPL